MDHRTLARIESIDRLIEMLQEERKAIMYDFKGNSDRWVALKSIADAILQSGFTRESIQSDKWAGVIVMNALFGRVRDDHNSKQQVKDVLQEIVAAGHLKIASEYSTRRGRGLPVYVAP